MTPATVPTVPLEDLLDSSASGFWGVEAGSSDADALMIRNGDILSSGEIRWSGLPLRGLRSTELEKARVHAGDLLLTTSGYCGQVAHVQAEPATPVCATNFVRRLRVRPEETDPRYLFQFMNRQEFRAALAPFIRGTTMQNLSLKNAAAATLVPLPPIEEQRRIADVLDQADKLRAKRRAALALLSRLTESIFLDMFGDPRSNPRGLEKHPLGDLIRVSSGVSASTSPLDELHTVPAYGGNGITGFVTEPMFSEPRLVIGRVGAYCGNVHRTEPRSWVTDNALVVTVTGEGLTEPYLLEALRMANLNQFASQSGQPLVSGSRIYPVKILRPSIADQAAFARATTDAAEVRTVCELGSSVLDNLFGSLQQRAFRGEL